MFKVNNKDNRTTPVNFEHVIAGWVVVWNVLNALLKITAVKGVKNTRKVNF